jgi:hypothetical protein
MITSVADYERGGVLRLTEYFHVPIGHRAWRPSCSIQIAMEGEMRRVTTGLVMALAWAASATVMAAGPDDRATVTVRIHDYVELPKRPLARTQSLVSAYYRAIRVDTKWRAVMQPSRLSSATPPTLHDDRDLTVIILSHSMALEKDLPDDAVGTAATTTDAPGRIAYVLYDRVVAAAVGAGWDPVDFMGVVIAHEIGHLLLPYGSHSPDGLMRGHWAVDDLRNVDRRTLKFSDGQAEQMRQLLLSYDLAPQLHPGPAGP